ncbi:uncharacterized protein LOC121189372 [Toxotes jaculatrix]|uniref:uncharacterized protein LOC121189372 n=1 Tax=Toxotes jaculatrix TaxID=941984 RepID=UPI001B3AC1AF|nr:uncharacterized protein LOC121189372 [Toxotes jaculatrix]
MAVWFPASQLLLIALLCWNVHCFPAKKGWGQHNPYEGSFSSSEMLPVFRYSSSPGAPAHPTNVNHPAVSFLHEPVERGVYTSPETDPGSSSATTDTSSGASWIVAPSWGPVEESVTAHSVSRTSQPGPNIGLPPPPPLYQAGELEHYEERFEHGNMERETEDLNIVPPPPPVPPYPGPDFQAGELSHYESIYEHGNEERETEEEGFRPLPPYTSSVKRAEEWPAASTSDSHLQSVPPGLGRVGPSQYYPFLTGQLPPGTVFHSQSDYETGSNNWDEVHYERYHFPIALSPVISTQTQEVPSDELWQLPKGHAKS